MTLQLQIVGECQCFICNKRRFQEERDLKENIGTLKKHLEEIGCLSDSLRRDYKDWFRTQEENKEHTNRR